MGNGVGEGEAVGRCVSVGHGVGDGAGVGAFVGTGVALSFAEELHAVACVPSSILTRRTEKVSPLVLDES